MNFGGGRMGRLWWFIAAVVLAGAGVLTWSSWSAVAQAPVQVETVVGDLQIPWAAEFTADGRIFLTERRGAIRVIRDGKVDAQPWASIQVAPVGEGGLLGLALSPDFARSGVVYVYHTYQDGGRLWNRVVRMVASGGLGRVPQGTIARSPGAGGREWGRRQCGADGHVC